MARKTQCTHDYNSGYAGGTQAALDDEELDYSDQDVVAQELFEQLEGRTVEDYTAFSEGFSAGYTTTYTATHDDEDEDETG
jgi:hypothetical protein